jgi:prolyl-tRNA synthetase
MKAIRSKYFIPFQRDTKFTGAIGQMIRGGFVHQEAPGIFTWLPLGMKMLEKISAIIDEEHAKVGAQKLLMPTLHPINLWRASGRYEEYGSEMLKIFDRNKNEFVYAPSSEEMATHLLTTWGINKESLPITIYNIQWKFRDEIRPRFGVVRAREFLMKDAYSFHASEECLHNTYQIMFEVYSKIFSRLGIDICTFEADVGLMGGSLSHEFITESEFGETEIQYNTWPTQPIQWNERNNAKLIEHINGAKKYAEIGHIYALGQKYTTTFKLNNPQTKQPLFMGCYGIGVSRLVAILFEKGINSGNLGVTAPFKYTILNIGQNESVINTAKLIFEKFDNIIWDDRDISYGQKCAEADLIGSPIQIHIGEKELQTNSVIIKKNNEKKLMQLSELI